MRTVILTLALAVNALHAQVSAERPQMPEPPYLYSSETITIDATDDVRDGDRWVLAAEEYTHTIAATITIPDKAIHGDGPFPGVVLISGSGPQTRDCEIMGHKYFLVLADHLTRYGIAVLRFDDRGVGESTGSYNDTPIEGHARDAFFAAHALMAHPDVDPGKVGLVGHSQGGTVAPYAAAHDPNIAFLVLMAGSGVPGSDVLYDQTEIIYHKTSFGEEYINAALEKRAELFAAACGDASEDELFEIVADIAQVEFRAPDRDNAEQLAETLMPRFLSAPMRSFMCFDPAPYLAEITVPVLALNGSLDTQVTPRLNLDAVRDALAQGGNKHATIVELSGLNHLFQEAESGELGEYGVIEQTISPRALNLVSTWITTTTRE